MAFTKPEKMYTKAIKIRITIRTMPIILSFFELVWDVTFIVAGIG